MNWSVGDYLFAAALFAVVGLCLALVMRATHSRAYRAGIGLALLGALLLVWVNGAVGFIGAPGNDANILYATLLPVGFAGAALLRFRARGMVWTMIGVALIQVLLPAGVVVIGLADSEQALQVPVLAATTVFAGIWLAAAWLFHCAGRDSQPIAPGA